MSLRVRILITVVTAALFGLGVYLYLSTLQETTTVLVATRAISARTQITADMVRSQKVGSADQALLIPNAYTKADQIIGAVAVVDILQGEVLRKDPRILTPRKDLPVQLAPNQRLKLSYIVPQGSRAVGVSLSASASVFDKVTRGDRVDIAVTGEAKDGPWSMIVLYHVEILDIAQNDNNQGSRDVVLLLSPQQSLDLLMAQRAGTLALLLNSPSEKPPEQAVPITSFSKFTHLPAPDKAQAAKTNP